MGGLVFAIILLIVSLIIFKVKPDDGIAAHFIPVVSTESAVNTVMALADTLQFTLDINLVDKCCRHYHDTNVAPILECLQRC